MNDIVIIIAIYKYNELQKTMSRLMRSLAFSNFVCSSTLPIALAATATWRISSSSLLNVLMVVPSNVPVSSWTCENFTPLVQAYTASILKTKKIIETAMVRKPCSSKTRWRDPLPVLREYGRFRDRQRFIGSPQGSSLQAPARSAAAQTDQMA